MSDFEERLRATVRERSEGFEPTPELPDRIHARVRQHRRRRQLVAGGAVSAAAAAVALVVLLGSDRSDDDSIRMIDRSTTTVEDPERSTSTSSTTSTTTTTSSPDTTTTLGTPTSDPGTETPSGSSPLVDSLTPLSRRGVGPITVGMTLRQAQAAAHITFTVAPPTGSRPCAEATISGEDPSPVFIVEPVGDDSLDGIVRAVWGGFVPTEDGAAVGQSRAELIAALGQPTRVDPLPDTVDPGDSSYLVFESGGHAYGAHVIGDLVLDLEVGDPAWLDPSEGCP
jgi:hypothetical protein